MLQTWSGSPLVGRVTKHYRNRIFNWVSAHVEPTGGKVDFLIRLQIPRVPRSENWTLAGSWQQGSTATAGWQQKGHVSRGTSEQVLRDGVEVMAIKGKEAFPAAIAAVRALGIYDILVENDDFRELYPDKIPDRVIRDQSRRALIERVRRFRKTKQELVAKHMAAGLREG